MDERTPSVHSIEFISIQPNKSLIVIDFGFKTSCLTNGKGFFGFIEMIAGLL